MILDKLAPRKNLIALMLCLGLVQIAGYYLAGMLASPDGNMAVPQPDTLLYCQAARRIVEGHPFSFSEGTAVCTGMTTILYPFLLAVPYAFGATGATLLMVGFWLNALFYLVFLLGWGQAIWHWLKHPESRLLAALLLVLSGQPAFSAMSQSDIGCWMAVSALLAWGLSVNQPLLYGPVLILAPWVRPEGMICVFAFGLFLITSRFFRVLRTTDEQIRAKWVVLTLATASILGVFALNFYLTGQAQFSSVVYKGYFVQFPFTKALYYTAGDLWCLTKEILLGLSVKIPRDFYSVPFIGGGLFLIGLFTYPWKDIWQTRALPTFLLACAGGLFTVAQSGWQGTNFDRYISWTLPLLYVLTASGAAFVTRHLPPNAVKGLLPLVLLAGASFNSLGLWATYNLAAKQTSREYLFCTREVAPLLSDRDSLGVAGLSSSAYAFSPRRIASLGGIFSPEFLAPPGEAYWIETLANEPQTRFTFWLVNLGSKEIDFPLHQVSQATLLSYDGIQLRRANWTAFDNAQRLHSTPSPRGSLVSQVDIAYLKSELAASYEPIDHSNRSPLPTFVRFGTLGGKNIIEGGRLLTDGDAMTLPVQVGQDLTVVMRTGPRVTLTNPREFSPYTQEYTFNSPLTLAAYIEDQPVGTFSCPLTTNDFSDVSLTIPGALITHTPCRLTLLGGRIAYGYWFFQ